MKGLLLADISWSLPCFPEAKPPAPSCGSLSISLETKTVTNPVQASITSSVGLVPNFLEACWGFLDTFASRGVGGLCAHR